VYDVLPLGSARDGERKQIGPRLTGHQSSSTKSASLSGHLWRESGATYIGEEEKAIQGIFTYVGCEYGIGANFGARRPPAAQAGKLAQASQDSSILNPGRAELVAYPSCD